MKKKIRPAFKTQHSTKNQPSTNTQHTTVNPQPTNTQHSTVTQQPTTQHTPLNPQFVAPFSSVYHSNLFFVPPRSIDWLWPNRLPQSAITLLDGDHGTGKSLLALTLAAHTSSGTPMPDGSTPKKAGVVIVTPNVDATSSQLQSLSSLGADLTRIEILSYIQDPENSSHPSGYRSFSLPEDLPRLFESVERVDAGLIILDPFIDLLSHEKRWTDQRLGSLLADLNQHLIERNIACLIVRNCPAKGGHARPSVLERSERFLCIATSRMLLAPDPINPNYLLLSHVKSAPNTLLTYTLILRIQRHIYDSRITAITCHGSHTLSAQDFLTHRPDALHRRLLTSRLLELITAATDPIPVATLYENSPHSSPSQIQRALRDLINMGQIERPARGFYAPAPPNPAFVRQTGSAQNRQAEAFVNTHAEELVHTLLEKIEDEELKARSIAVLWSEIVKCGDRTLAYSRILARLLRGEDLLDEQPQPTPTPQPPSSLNLAGATTPIPESAISLNLTGATTPIPESATSLNLTGATTPIPEPATSLNLTGATTPIPEPATSLNLTGATTPIPEPATSLNLTGATTPTPEPTIATVVTTSGLKFLVPTPEQLREKALREMAIEDDRPGGPWRRL
jgi:AAA domain